MGATQLQSMQSDDGTKKNIGNINDYSISVTEAEQMIADGKNLLCNPFDATGTITDANEVVGVDTSVNDAFTLTLDSNANFNNGKPLEINDIGGYCTSKNVTIATSGTGKFYGKGLARTGGTSIALNVDNGQIKIRKFSSDFYFVTGDFV